MYQKRDLFRASRRLRRPIHFCVSGGPGSPRAARSATHTKRLRTAGGSEESRRKDNTNAKYNKRRSPPPFSLVPPHAPNTTGVLQPPVPLLASLPLRRRPTSAL